MIDKETQQYIHANSDRAGHRVLDRNLRKVNHTMLLDNSGTIFVSDRRNKYTITKIDEQTGKIDSVTLDSEQFRNLQLV